MNLQLEGGETTTVNAPMMSRTCISSASPTSSTGQARTQSTYENHRAFYSAHWATGADVNIGLEVSRFRGSIRSHRDSAQGQCSAILSVGMVAVVAGLLRRCAPVRSLRELSRLASLPEPAALAEDVQHVAEDHSAITDECDTCDRIDAGELSKLGDWQDAIRYHNQFSPYGTSSMP